MHAAEVAKRLGVTVATFYRRRPKLHMVDGMPRPITSTGRPSYDRASMEAWLTRNDPRRPPAAANDSIAPPMPNSDAEWNRFLRQTYGQPAE
ncbi:hypothetical protein [Tardiphaga sp.]|jgi:predicted DNA-binding transcriptional regulator AlpA|uniref:hypothetical protein n=1 Tax=Tardiphaga sp. TaxID=1926292 RepID=UPI0037DA4767